MPYIIDVQSTRRLPADLARAVARAANESLVHEGVNEGAGVTVLLSDDDYIQRLNWQYRGEDRPTDVLSFPAGDPVPGAPETDAYLGDIAISVPCAERQAAAKGHLMVAELQLLTIHGVLHLLGYDHLEASDKAAMWTVQAEILRGLGLETIQPTEDEHTDDANGGKHGY